MPSAWAAIPTRLSNAQQPPRGTTCTQSAHVEPIAPYFSSMAGPSASTSNSPADAPAVATTTNISAPDAASPIMVLKLALEQRKLRALTPYKPMAWEHALRQAGLLKKYGHLPCAMQIGFDLHIPRITHTQAPPNKDSVGRPEHAEAFQKIIVAEFEKDRYLGRCTQAELESLIYPFQSSPFGIIPKRGRPGHFQNIQNYSFPHKVSRAFPNPSIKMPPISQPRGAPSPRWPYSSPGCRLAPRQRREMWLKPIVQFPSIPRSGRAPLLGLMVIHSPLTRPCFLGTACPQVFMAVSVMPAPSCSV